MTSQTSKAFNKFDRPDGLELENRIGNLEKFPPYGSVVTVKFTGSTERRVYHGLGFSPSGYIVVRCKYTEACVLYEANKSPAESEYLLLTNSVGVSANPTEVTIWFF